MCLLEILLLDSLLPLSIFPPVKTNIALLGCGYWGKNFLRLLSRHPEVELLGVCDPNPDRRAENQALYPDVPFFEDWRETLAQPGLEAVVVSTPPATHREIVTECLTKGKHVLCEKPLTTSTTESEALAQLAEQHKKVLMIGHTFLFHPAVRHIRQLIHEKAFGRPLYAHMQRTGLGIVRDDVDVVWDVAPHDIAILLYLFGEMPNAVSAFAMSPHRKNHAEVAFLVLEFPSGMLVKVHVSWLDPIKTRKFTLVGENQMIVFDDVSMSEKVTIHQKASSYQPAGGEFGEFQSAMRAGDILIPHLPNTEPLRMEVDEFLHALRGGGDYLSDGRFSTDVTRILEAAQKSAAQGNLRIPI